MGKTLNELDKEDAIAALAWTNMWEIYPDIRAIVYKYDPEKRDVFVRWYMDREPTPDDIDNLGAANTEFVGGYCNGLIILHFDEECVYSAKPLDKLDMLDGIVYARKEYNSENIKFPFPSNSNKPKFEFSNIRRYIFYVMTYAFLGEIYPEIRAIVYKYDSVRKHFILRYYLDREPIEQDFLNAQRVMSKFTSYAGEAHVTSSEVECVYSNEFIGKLDLMDGHLYGRWESRI